MVGFASLSGVFNVKSCTETQMGFRSGRVGTRLYENPIHLPQWIQEQIDHPEPKAIVIKDYIAGMTDNFARETVFKLRKRLI